ncbi:isochorismate synthase [Cytobacillus gottheilii]|uniref:isochorismate synthase n=1 Tax=Cytobacillus gottheilii TaxID=859144 RepID=UPI003CE70388
MVTIHDTELKEGIHEAIEKAKALSKPILVSEVKKINEIDPLLFFHAGQARYEGERFFWKEDSGNEVFVGMGICGQIQSDQAADRFFLVKKEWEALLQDMVIYNSYSNKGTGPLLFGGFSFDPNKEKTKLWSKFSHSLFHLPLFMYSIIDGEAFLTTNVICTQHDDLSLYKKIEANRQAILTDLPSGLPARSNALLKDEEINPEAWMETVESVVNDMMNGLYQKVVLAREERLAFSQQISIEDVLGNLLSRQKNSFIFAFEASGDCFIGATPERLVKKEGKTLFSTCLAGSIRRGVTEEEDQELGKELLQDPKNTVEHHYVVEMITAAMKETCESVSIPDKPVLMKLKDIQHLYTPVTGTANKDSSLLTLVERLHPTPALGGVPTESAIKVIREREELDRGFYAAPIGWMDYRGDGEFAVALRSGLIQGDEASIFAGCGVVQHSDPLSEYEETKIKFRPMRSALGGMKQ